MIERNICICKNCGYISIENELNSCPVCNSQMTRTEETLHSLVDKYRDNPKELQVFFDSLINTCDKAILKANRKASKQLWASFFTKESQVKLKQPVLVCNSCGHITGASCLFDDACECCICKSPYVKAKISTLDYFMRRESYDFPAINNLEDKLRNKHCTSLNEGSISERNKIEDVYLPAHIELCRINTELPPFLNGVVPALFNSIRETKAAASAIWELFIVFLSCLSLCEVAEGEGNSQARLWIMELLTNTFNVLRCQGFSGQQKAACIIMSIITDLAKLC